VTRLELLRRRLAMENDMNDTIMFSRTATATVPTTHASRYLQQLCKHWSHKLTVEFDATHGTIRFPSGAVTTLDATPDALTVAISASDVETLAQMKRVVAEHLDRFAFREAPLPFDWR
jgi:hypothetical protein